MAHEPDRQFLSPHFHQAAETNFLSLMLMKFPVWMITAACVALPFTMQAQPDPQAFLNRVKSNAGLSNSTGEQFAWHANFRARYFVDAYLAYEDPAWLEAAEHYFDFVIERGVSVDPDGYRGVIGALIGESLDDPTVNLLYDALVGDALIGSHIVRFAEVVKSRPALHSRFLATADRYIELATEMVWLKWNARGTYYRDALGYGSYHTHPFAISRADRSMWVPQPQRKISENLNKHYEAGVTLLRLYRITGNVEYRDRVLELFGRAKAMFRLFPAQDRVVWNFWMPHGPWDMMGSVPVSWVGVHAIRPFYQDIESRIFLEVYNSGLVFTEEDMRRIVNTNLWMMDNGFAAADGSSSAGQLWSALAQLEPLIRQAYADSLAGSTAPEDLIQLAYLETVVDPAAGYNRRFVSADQELYLDPVSVQPGTRLIMALPIPDQVQTINNDRIQLVARTAGSGQVTVELLSAGGELIGLLDSSPTGGQFHSYTWDGTNPRTGEKGWGDYLVRWTFGGESRTWPVSVVEGEPRPDNGSVLRIRPGETLRYDFESPLDERWTISGAADVTTVRSESGSHALRLGRNARVDLLVGDTEGMPLRIEFSVYDGGAMFGSNWAFGAMWGTRDAVGDVFAIGMRWHQALDGDNRLIWVNSGENQFWTFRNANLNRILGWSRWSFDYSRYPEPPVIKQDDNVMNNAAVTVGGNWLPHSAVGVTFIGPDLSGTALTNAILYVDNVTVTHTAPPVSVYQNSSFTENLGGGWHHNQLGYLYDALFPWVYSTAFESWLFVAGFSEWQGYYFWVERYNSWAYTRGELYPQAAFVSGPQAGTWIEVVP
jgi:hypothetical protein